MHAHVLSQKELRFFLFALDGATEGSLGVHVLTHIFCISSSVPSNYLAHCKFGVFRSLCDCPDALVDWPTGSQRFEMTDVMRCFPNAIGFVNGFNSVCLQPATEPKQTDKYDGHKKHCNAALVWVDVRGLLIRLYFTTIRRTHDRSLFNLSDPIIHPVVVR